jgi:uncharacterized protein (TIGR00255 family)
MLNSMTGYGEATGELEGVSYAVEIKAVNSRYLKTIIKLPEGTSYLEDAIDKELRGQLARGTINCVLRFKSISADSLLEIDEVSLRGIVSRLKDVGTAAGVAGTIDLAGLLALPGIVQPAKPDEEAGERIKRLVLDLTREATEKLRRMREAEGRFLEADLRKNCDVIERELKVVSERTGLVVQEYAKRLRKRVDELLAEAKLTLDEQTLAREVAIMADRSDVSEEIARLDAHVQQFRQICQMDGQAGRRLDFLSQEMLREANTVASKSADPEIARRIVEVKCLIERLKEQIQNVE